MALVLVGKLNTFVINDPPLDITDVVRRSNPTAAPRMLTRFPDSPTGSAQLSSVCTTCTHHGCNLAKGSYDVASMVITCQCHGSEYNVVSGAVVLAYQPPQARLARFAVQLDGQDVLVDTDPVPGDVVWLG